MGIKMAISGWAIRVGAFSGSMVDFVYVLRSQSTGRRYVGRAGDLERCLCNHNSTGHAARELTSKNPGPWIVIHSEEHDARRNLMDLHSGVGMLQDRPGFLRWLSDAARKSNVREYEIDRLIPRRDTFDLRIRVQDQKGKWRPLAFQIVAAPGAGKSTFQLGPWDLVYRDPLDDLQVHIAKALDDGMRAQISGLLGVAVVESSLFAYAPDRRGVVRYGTNDGRRYFGKLYRSGRSEHAAEQDQA